MGVPIDMQSLVVSPGTPELLIRGRTKAAAIADLAISMARSAVKSGMRQLQLA